MRFAQLNTRLFLFAIFAATVVDGVGQKDEDYRVYDAVVRAMFREGITRFDMGAKIEQIVIRDHTFSNYARGDKKEDWDQVKIRLRSLTDDTIAGYESSRKGEIGLKKKFEIPFKYSLISDKQLFKIFPNKHEYNKSEEQWAGFYKMYPDSAGYNSISRVGYDKERRHALVYFVNWCRPFCGTGTYVLVENGQAGWAVKESAGMWIS